MRSDFSLNSNNIWPEKLLELKYIIITSTRNAAAIAKGYGRIEAIHSFLLKRRERTLAARSEVLEMLEVKGDRWFGRLDDDSRKVKWMRRVYPGVDYTQAPRTVAGTPWTVVMIRQPSQNIHTSREA